MGGPFRIEYQVRTKGRATTATFEIDNLNKIAAVALYDALKTNTYPVLFKGDGLEPQFAEVDDLR